LLVAVALTGCAGGASPAAFERFDTGASASMVFATPGLHDSMGAAPDMLGFAPPEHNRRDALLGVPTEASLYTARWFPGMPGPGGAQPDYRAYVQDRLTRGRNGYTYRYSRTTSPYGRSYYRRD